MVAEGAVRLIPFGGLGEFGLNSLALECAGRLLLIDAGQMVPAADLPGVDTIVPDFQYLAANRDRIEGIVLTHGHEDHTGALAHALTAAPAPVFGSPLTIGLAQRRLRERGVTADLRPMTPAEPVTLGPFRVHAVHVAHSVSQSHALIIETPAGVVAVSGDFKLAGSERPEDDTDVATLAAWGQRGVLALLSDSTNVEWPGRTPGENTVAPALEAVFDRARGRVLVTCFATALARIQRIVDIARNHGRRAAFVGRRIAENADVAQNLGLLELEAFDLLSPQAAAALPPEQAVFLLSGSQGEPLSALSLIALDQHRDIRVGPDDILIHSARVIPGNERGVARIFDHLYRRGCEVVHAGNARVHVSGHGSREDLIEMIGLLRPRYFVPIHGEYRMLVQHARLAVEAGVPADQVQLIEDGACLLLDAQEARRDGTVAAGRTLIDRCGGEEIEELVVRDRRHLSSDGIVVPVIVVEKESGKLSSAPEIVTRGLVDANGASALVEDAGRLVLEALEARTPEEHQDPGLTRERVRLALARFLKKRTQRRPLVVPVIMEV